MHCEDAELVLVGKKDCGSVQLVLGLSPCSKSNLVKSMDGAPTAALQTFPAQGNLGQTPAEATPKDLDGPHGRVGDLALSAGVTQSSGGFPETCERRTGVDPTEEGFQHI